MRQIVADLRAIYCGRIGVEYMHIQVLAERQWIQQKFENRDARPSLTGVAKKEVLQILTAAETFERFLDRRYTGTKRFGIEGAESLMPALESILRCGAEFGVKEYDIAALVPIVTEAGGRFTSFEGEDSLSQRSALATNGVLHAAFLDLLHTPPTPESTQ